MARARQCRRRRRIATRATKDELKIISERIVTYLSTEELQGSSGILLDTGEAFEISILESTFGERFSLLDLNGR